MPIPERWNGATPGPWALVAPDFSDIPPHVVTKFVDAKGRRCTGYIAVCNSTTLPNAANAALIADAHYLPRLVEALMECSARHPISCALYVEQRCTCGALKARALLAEIQKGPQ